MDHQAFEDTSAKPEESEDPKPKKQRTEKSARNKVVKPGKHQSSQATPSFPDRTDVCQDSGRKVVEDEDDEEEEASS